MSTRYKGCLLFLILFLFALNTNVFAQVRNGGFEARGPLPPYFTQATVDNYRKAGWKCPDIAEWPQGWSVYGNNGTAEFPATGGVVGGYAKIGGEGVYFNGYYGLELGKSNYVYTIWARGKGRLHMHVASYGKNDEGTIVQINKAGEAAASITVDVNSEKWVKYQHLIVKTPALYTFHVWIGIMKGTLDIDEVDIEPSTPALDLIVQQEEKLYGTGALIEDKDAVKTDDAFAERLKSYKEALSAFTQAKGSLDKELVSSMEAELKTLAPYLLTEGLSVVRGPYYNEMIALTQVLNILAGKKPVTPAAVTATEATAPAKQDFYLLGRRDPIAGKITITDLRSDKVRYDENENATTTAKIANMTAAEQKGTLVARMHLDIDTVREIGREECSLPVGQSKEWRFSYNVGPETYGRAIEVQFVDEQGKVADSWSEYYAVAAEWFRVQQTSNNAPMKSYTVDFFTEYFNQQHQFASEPTDWGVQDEECAGLDEYLSAGPLYHLGMPPRRAQYAFNKTLGVMGTFYQNMSYGGQMGYEVIRQHPEFALYDPSGQFAVDPFYGGYPNPMELASPIEIGPKRKVLKPYLDRKLTSWQHGMVNLAREDVVRYMAERIKEHAAFLNAGGVYIDGNVGVWAGYGYDGKPNVPGNKAEDYAELNARNHNLFSGILKKENPNFGTWYNWAFSYAEWFIRQGLGSTYMGSGTGTAGDPNDKNVKAAAGWRNVMFLDESVFQFTDSVDPLRYPDKELDHFCENRDYLVQKYGANVMIGYIHDFAISHDVPGPDRWGWATLNYFGAELIATQQHFFTWWVPSIRPTGQFMARYSRFIWAPDIKVVPETKKMVMVTGSKEVWWKRLVYKRDTADGYDLIIHLVRIPPYEKWDLKWVDEPRPLAGVSVTADIGAGSVQGAYALRPYYFEEEQQVVENKLNPSVSSGKATIEVPPFKYYTMVVLQVKTGNKN